MFAGDASSTSANTTDSVVVAFLAKRVGTGEVFSMLATFKESLELFWVGTPTLSAHHDNACDLS